MEHVDDQLCGKPQNLATGVANAYPFSFVLVIPHSAFPPLALPNSHCQLNPLDAPWPPRESRRAFH